MMQFGDDTQTHDLARENETLRAENERLQVQWTGMKSEVQRCHADNERLRADTDTHDQVYQIMTAECDGLRAEIERLTADNERLRAAAAKACAWLLLPENQDLPGSDAIYRELDDARAALEPKP